MQKLGVVLIALAVLAFSAPAASAPPVCHFDQLDRELNLAILAGDLSTARDRLRVLQTQCPSGEVFEGTSEAALARNVDQSIKRNGPRYEALSAALNGSAATTEEARKGAACGKATRTTSGPSMGKERPLRRSDLAVVSANCPLEVAKPLVAAFEAEQARECGSARAQLAPAGDWRTTMDARRMVASRGCEDAPTTQAAAAFDARLVAYCGGGVARSGAQAEGGDLAGARATLAATFAAFKDDVGRNRAITDDDRTDVNLCGDEAAATEAVEAAWAKGRAARVAAGRNLIIAADLAGAAARTRLTTTAKLAASDPVVMQAAAGVCGDYMSLEVIKEERARQARIDQTSGTIDLAQRRRLGAATVAIEDSIKRNVAAFRASGGKPPAGASKSYYCGVSEKAQKTRADYAELATTTVPTKLAARFKKESTGLGLAPDEREDALTSTAAQLACLAPGSTEAVAVTRELARQRAASLPPDFFIAAYVSAVSATVPAKDLDKIEAEHLAFLAKRGSDLAATRAFFAEKRAPAKVAPTRLFYDLGGSPDDAELRIDDVAASAEKIIAVGPTTTAVNMSMEQLKPSGLDRFDVMVFVGTQPPCN